MRILTRFMLDTLRGIRGYNIIDLPQLGGVTARLSMSGNAVSLKFEVADDQTAHKMETARAQLIASLTARGVPVLQTLIERTPEVPR